MAETDLNSTDAAERAYAAAAAERARARKEPAADRKEVAHEEVAEEDVAKEAVEVETVEVEPAQARAKKPAAAKAGAKPPAAKPAGGAPAAKPDILAGLKDSKLASAGRNRAEDFGARVQDAVKDAQDRASAALERGQTLFSEVGEFTRGNLEALAESGKIFGNGVEEIGRAYVESARTTAAAVREDVKELGTVKDPGEFIKLQGELVRKYFDSAIDLNAKNTEAALKLAGDAIRPLAERVSLAVEKIKQAA